MLLALTLAAALAADAPAPSIAPLLADPTAARAFDYMTLRDQVGVGGLATLSQGLEASLGERLKAAPGACETEAEALVRVGLVTALTAKDPAVWRTDWKAADEKREALYVRVARVTKGEDVGGADYAGARAAARKAAAATDPRRRQLFARVARDQAMRYAIHDIWALPTGPMQDMVKRPFLTRLCEVDTDNLVWLKAEWRENGWFTAARDGAEASGNAWLLAQHADRDPDFQRALLPVLALATDMQGKINYAYLADRVATNAGEPQVYGTQGRCVGPGRWEPDTVKDPEGLDARRLALGLGSEADYQSHFQAVCANFKAS